MSKQGNIIIKGARVHNLKNIDVEIPRNKLVVVTGLSGSGKSSLAFDTVYAEGQRRYVESLSAYARQFLGRMAKPEVDYIKGIPPAIAIEQKVNTRNPRSTVGTSTEIYDYLKLLYARVGKTYSPVSGELVKKHEAEDVVEAALTYPDGTKLMILAPVVCKHDGCVEDALREYLQSGFSRVMIKEEVKQIQEVLDEKKKIVPKDIYLVIDRLAVDRSPSGISRLTDSVETAFYEGKDTCVLYVFSDVEQENGSEKIKSTKSDKFLNSSTKTPPLGGRGASQGARLFFSKAFEADGIRFELPNENMFSFNNPLGACPVCEGFGKVIGIDEDLVVPNKTLSIYQDAVVAWKGEVMSEWKKELVYSADKFSFPIHTPYIDLTDEQKQLLWTGNRYFGGLNAFFQHLESNQYKIQYRVMLARYRGKTVCPQCKGTRLKKEATYVKINGKPITELVLLPITELKLFLENIPLDAHDAVVGKRLLTEINNRVNYLLDVGLGYLTLNRLSNTLSGGESQRINLASSLGSSLVGSIYILDEPSIGLHSRDTHLLIKVLKLLRDLGNTVLVVEHDEEIMRAADYIIDIGPNAGRAGGNVVYAGLPPTILMPLPPKSPKEDFLGSENKQDNTIYQEKISDNSINQDVAEVPLGGFRGQQGQEDEQILIWKTANHFLYSRLTELAKEHRKNPTESENLLWKSLSNKKLGNYKFRREHIIGDVIVDFVNLENKLVVEVDGGYHKNPDVQEYDKLRTFYLNEKGYKVIRFTNEEVLNQTEEVLQRIKKYLDKISNSMPPKSPTPIPLRDFPLKGEEKGKVFGDFLGSENNQDNTIYQEKISDNSINQDVAELPLGGFRGQQGQKSYTLDYLLGTEKIDLPDHRRKWNNYIEVIGARENNLKNVRVKFPLNVLTVVTGVSGSGKSSLVKNVFYPALKKLYGGVADKTGQFSGIEGSTHLANDIEFVDQNPIGRSSRSNPVTYIKAYDEIRKLFADQQLSKQMGFTPGYFSFNTPGGRCEECQGEGTVTVEMQFMADLVLECEHCHGKRFKQDILDVKYKGVNIADVLDMTVNQAIEFFEKQSGNTEKKIVKRLKPLQDVGIGYVKLGQSSATLSGGESQRVKLASFLAGEKAEPTIFVFDEPTTGLHFHDIKTLLKAFEALLKKGHTVIIIEHNMEVIKCADHIIDIGPEGGDQGGNIVFEGAPEELIQCENSYTGKFLKEKL